MDRNQIQGSHLNDHSNSYHQLYRYASEGRESDFITAIQEVAKCNQNGWIQLLSRLSPQNNSFLHTAVAFGHTSLAIKIMELHPPLLLVKNFEGDTALHVAAKIGGSGDHMIRCIMEHVHYGATDIEKVDISVFRMKNDEENTPLHEALINGNYLEAKYLIKADPSVSFCANKERKSPLYLAAEAGLVEIVTLISDTSHTTAVQNNTGDQGNGISHINSVMEGKSPLYAAILSQKEDVLGLISRMPMTLQHAEDVTGRTALHCAASTGFLEGLRFLIERCPSDSYRADTSGTFPIHSASIKGHVDVVKLLLEHYPDLKELRNSSGENILHVAAKCGRDNLVKYFLRKGEFKMLINQKDKAGNTPLHLATVFRQPAVVHILTWDQRFKLNILNVRGMTALDIAENTLETSASFHGRLVWIALKSAGAQRAQSSNPLLRKTGQNAQQESLISAIKPLGDNGGDVITQSEDATVRVADSCTNVQLVKPNKQSNKDTVNTLLVVTTLIATVSFAAGFTMPGGYNNSGPEEGMAILLNKHMFQVFVISDTLAMYSSVIVAVTLIWAQVGDLSLVPLRIALPFLGLALTMLSLAFMAGVFVVVSSLQWLANVVMMMGAVFLFTVIAQFTPLFFPSQLFPTTSNFRVLRYIIYYPFCLAALVAVSHDNLEEED